MPSQEDKVLSMLMYVVSFVFPIIGPLVIWLIKKDSSPFIDYHGREYFNFFISYLVYGFVASITTIILIGFILAPIVGIAAIVFTIIAAIKSYEGMEYRIPYIFRIF